MITVSDRDAWRHSTCTNELIEDLIKAREALKEAWAAGAFTKDFDAETKAVGVLANIEYVFDKINEISKEDTQDETSASEST